MEDGRVGNEELLVTRSHQRSKVICKGVQCLPKKQELNITTGRKTDAKLDSRKGMDSLVQTSLQSCLWHNNMTQF